MTGRMSEYTQEERRQRKREEGMDGSREGERESEKREGEGGRRASTSGNPTAASASVSSEIVFAPSWLVSSGDSLLTQLGSHIRSTAVL